MVVTIVSTTLIAVIGGNEWLSLFYRHYYLIYYVSFVLTCRALPNQEVIWYLSG